MQTELVSVHRDGGLAVLTLNVPERRNVLSASLVEQIGAAFDGLEADPAMRGVVLTGAGSAFCAGAELGSLWAATEGDFSQIEAVYDGFLRVLHSPLATIAAINGPAVGAGLNLALACDIRLASERAVFDTRFARLRIHPGGGHLWMLARAVGQQQAMLACLFGEVWDAPAAAQRGLVAAVHPHDQLLDAAIALGHRLDDQEPVFTRRLVATARAALGTAQHGEALALEAEAQRWSTMRPAFLAGIEAIKAMIRTRRSESTTTSGPF